MVRTSIRKFGMISIVAAAAAGGLAFGAGTASAATPFTCTGQVFLAQAKGAGTQLYSGTFGAGSIGFSPVGPVAGANYNAIGYNPNDNYIYGIRSDNNALWQVDANGAVTGYGPVSGLPAIGSTVGGVTVGGFNIGAFGADGYLYATASDLTRMWAIDVTTNKVVRTVNLTAATGVSDMVYADGYFWGADTNGGIVRINPNTGGVETFAGKLPAGTYGGIFAYGNGDIGFYDNAGTLYRVAITNGGSAAPSFQRISTQAGPSSGGNDATSCVAAPVDLGILKTGPGSVEPGQTVTYTLVIHNYSDTGSSGYTVTDQLPAGLTNVTTSSPGCTVQQLLLTCTGGALGPGKDATVTVTGTPADGVTQLDNTATVRGNEEDPNPANDTSNTVVTDVVPMVSAGVAAGALTLFGAGFGLRRRSRRKNLA